MKRDRAITKAQALAMQKKQNMHVVYDPTANDYKSPTEAQAHGFFVADEYEVDEFFNGAQIVCTIAPM